MFTAGVITISDSSANNLREDISGKVLKELLEKKGFTFMDYKIVEDDINQIQTALNLMINAEINLILTTGGTGFSTKDITPEATLPLLEKKTPGIDEAIRQNSAKFTPRYMLSRAVSGITKKSIIVNLPGSPKACKQCAEFLLDNLNHGLEILLGQTFKCGE